MKGSERNQPCACGSGLKAKKCRCREEAAEKLRALRDAADRELAQQVAGQYLSRRRMSGITTAALVAIATSKS